MNTDRTVLLSENTLSDYIEDTIDEVVSRLAHSAECAEKDGVNISPMAINVIGIVVTDALCTLSEKIFDE